MTRIVALSDTHNRHNQLVIPECDILIHAGDESFRGLKSETENFAKWFNKQPATYKLWTPGNHSVEFAEKYPQSLDWFYDHCPDGEVLINESIELEGLKIFMSPWTPWFYDWAYNAGRDPNEAAARNIPYIKQFWDMIPAGTDVLITHGPAFEILDRCPDGRKVGCAELFNKILEIKPRVHICGHIHHSYGEMSFLDTRYYNVSNCDERYQLTNPPTVIDL